LEIETTRFGILHVREDQLIDLPSGILGFPEDKRYALFNHQEGSPFFWLQSMDHGALAFALIDPFLIKPDYELQVTPEDTAALQLEEGEGALRDVQPMVIVNISREEPRVITANLMGPVVINFKKRVAKQVVLDHQHYSHRFPITLAKDGENPVKGG
jgi:flagellar assembly factor FliW